MQDNRDISDTSYLDALNEETQFMNRSYQQALRLKIGKGCSARCRFLPARLGPRGLWFARISQYWANKRPIVCAKETHPDFGGTDEPDAYYKLIQKYLDSNDTNVQKVARRAAPVTQWLTYCLVLEIEDDRRRKKITDDPECWSPYEFWNYRANFAELSNIFEKRRKSSPLSILDPVSGCDLWLNRSNRGIRFERDDASPICDGDDAEVRAFMDEIVSKINFKVPALPSKEKIDELCEKFEDDIARASRRHGSADDDDVSYDDDDGNYGSRSEDRRQHGRDNDDDDNDYRSEDRRAHARNNDDDGDRRRHSRDDYDDDDSSDARTLDEGVTGRTHLATSGGARHSPLPMSRHPVRHADVERADEDGIDDEVNDDAQENAPVPRHHVNDVPEAPRAAEDRPAPRRVIAPPPASVKTVTNATSSVDDDDNVTDEDSDKVPPVVDAATPPPPVENGGGQVRKLSSALSAKLAQNR